MKWELIEDAYWKESRYVDDAGRIVGSVRGFNYGRSIRAYGEDLLYLGDFVTESEAKEAVEAYWKSNACRETEER